MSNEDYPGLEIWSQRGQKNSFYIEQDPLIRAHASSNTADPNGLNRYNYCIDSNNPNQILQIRHGNS